MIGGTGIPQNPQAAMARRPKPEDAASYITVRFHYFPFDYIGIDGNCFGFYDCCSCLDW